MKRITVYSILFLLAISAKAQTPQVLDKVVAVVGSKIVLQSDVDQQYAEYVAENPGTTDTKCRVVEDLMYQKLLLLEAEKDSTLVVSDAQVEQELDKRMTHFIDQFGSKEKFESFYGKTVQQSKDELRGDVKDLLLAQQMRGKVTEGLTVSPEDVRKYFESIPADSVPFINAQVEIAQIVRMPVLNDQEKQVAKAKAEELRQRVLKGESMSTLAILYSEDPGSAKNQGEYKNMRRGEFLPEFEKIAFGLSEGETSQVFETEYGFHFIQLIHRHGDYLDIKHILIIPKVSPEDLAKSKQELDSIYGLIKKDSVSFSQAAAMFSDDKETKYNGGTIINPQTGLSRWDMEQLGQFDPTVSFTINNMKVGDISNPEFYNTHDAKQAYRIILLKNTTKPHKANLKDDYQQIQSAALVKKQIKTINNWITRKIKEGVYIKIDPIYTNCHFQNNWISS
ncbi:MAG TPA: peptidylprolyl isomerase [Bacteroidia bacterium]|nr:peptidylprolyl isomerase [Bacteroidia bacterium]